MDPVEDMAEKKISSPRSCRAAIHDGNNTVSGVTIRCHGDDSDIGDYKLSLPKSRLQPKSQRRARLSKVLIIVSKFQSKVGKCRLIVVFPFLEADAAKPRTRSCTRTHLQNGVLLGNRTYMQRQSHFWKSRRGKILRQGNSVYTGSPKLKPQH